MHLNLSTQLDGVIVAELPVDPADLDIPDLLVLRQQLSEVTESNTYFLSSGFPQAEAEDAPPKGFHQPENYDKVEDLPGGRALWAGANDWEVGWTWAWIKDKDGKIVAWKEVDHKDCPACKGDPDNADRRPKSTECQAYAKKDVKDWVDGLDTDDHRFLARKKSSGVRHAQTGGQYVQGDLFSGGQFLPADADDPVERKDTKTPEKVPAKGDANQEKSARGKPIAADVDDGSLRHAKCTRANRAAAFEAAGKSAKRAAGLAMMAWGHLEDDEQQAFLAGADRLEGKEANSDGPPPNKMTREESPTEVIANEPVERKSGPGDGLPGGKSVGGEAGPAPARELPEPSEPIGERVQELSQSPGESGVPASGSPGEEGAGHDDSRGVGAGRPVAEPADAGGSSGVGGGSGGDDGGGRPVTTGPGEQVISQPPTPENPTDIAAGNWRYENNDFIKGSPRSKILANIEAVKLLKEIQGEGRAATPEEQTVLAKYCGWGQFKRLFAYGDNELTDLQDEVKSLISDEDFEAMRHSTGNAHFTHPDVVRAHWQIAQKLGFQGGRYLEPSAGNGYYLGMMPPALASATHVTATELDPTTGGMLKLLYPSANAKVQGFQDLDAPDDFYDLVASNVPFGKVKVADPRYDKFNASIHDYFFLKSLDKTKPGGLVMHLTSRYSLDKPDGRGIREELAKQADFVGALRFPGGAHKENAGTEVVTDMIILRKRLPGEAPGDRSWLETTTVPDPAGGEPMEVNKYFAQHPEQILGTLDRTGTMRGPDQVNVSPTADYEQRLAAAINRMPSNVFNPEKVDQHVYTPEAQPAPGEVKIGGYHVQGDKIFRREPTGGMVEQTDVGKLEFQRIKGQLTVRDARRAVVYAEMAKQDAEPARQALNAAYDAFVAKHGHLNEKMNKRAMRGDPDAPVLLSLEKYNPETGEATKNDMFRKETIRGGRQAEKADTPEESLGISLHETGGVNLSRMAALLGKPAAEIGQHLVDQGLAYEDPSEGWKPTDQYLSGNVRRKLANARAAAETDPTFKVNVAALEKVQPPDIGIEDIDVKIGAPWVSPADHSAFAASLLDTKPEHITVANVGKTGEWLAARAGNAPYSEAAKKIWGTDRASFMDIMTAAMNGSVIRIKDSETLPDGTKKDYVNQEATDDANGKVQEMKEAFKDWIWQDPSRAERLGRHYNDNFNNIVPIKYNGQFQQFPGMNPDIKLHPHIKDFVWQVVSTGGGLAAHEVGSGKAQPLDAKILTPTGWSRMGTIHLGDDVIAGDGTVTKVTGIFPQGEKEIFRVTFSDGGSTECCEEHLWLTQTYRERNQAINFKRFAKSEWTCDKAKVRTLAEIRETLVSPHLGAKNHSVPVVGQVDFASEPVPIDPYLLGVLLGDGSISQNQAKITTGDEEIIEYATAGLPKTVLMRESLSARRSGCGTWSIVRLRRAGFGKDRLPNPFVETLAELGLIGCRSHNKFIPSVYKINDSSVRLGILQGLFDTDGSISSRDNSIHYYTVSNELAEDVIFLVRSLGGMVSRRIKHPTYTYKGEKKKGRPCHDLCINLPPGLMPFRLKRKADLVVDKTKYKPARYIVGVEPVGRKQAQCIRVDHPSHLYVTDDFVVTHNTYSMIASAMELRRLGLAKKPCIACLKANVEAITADALKLYPGIKILSTEHNFDAKNRKEAISQIASGDYDLVVMTHDHLNLLPMKSETQKAFITEEMQELRAATLAAEAASEGGGKKTAGAKLMGKLRDQMANLEAKLKKVTDAGNKDDAVTFEETGIDTLMVDESHQFKNLPITTKHENLKGIPSSDSDRALNMLMRTQWLQQQNGGRGVVFATGTPVGNTMAELYNVQRFLQPDQLKERGLNSFDAWANAFGEVESNMEFTVAGELKNVARFSAFTNVNELMQITRQMMDVQRVDDINEHAPDGKKVIIRPDKVVTPVKSPNSEGMKDLMTELRSRAEAIKGKRRQKGEDNMLTICTDGRKGSVDLRMLDANAPDDPENKTNQCVRNVLRFSKENPGVTQCIFSDVGVHPTKQGFHLYGDIIAKLVAGGLSQDQIADFSNLEGAKKEVAQEKMREGKILVALGGTQKLGTGVNVQNRLGAIHHLDVPWRPADIEQRDGRGWRHGNANPTGKIAIHRYVTEGSLDQAFWAVVSRKAAFIAQIMDPKTTGVRRMEDEDTEELTPDEMSAIASGDPRVMEKVQLDQHIKELTAHQRRHERTQTGYAARTRKLAEEIPEREQKAASWHAMAKTLDDNPEFSLTIDGVTYDKRPEAKLALDHKIATTHVPSWDVATIATYRGIPIIKDHNGLALYGDKHQVGLVTATLGGIEATARKAGERATAADEDAAQAKTDVEKIKGLTGQKFPKAELLEGKRKRHAELMAELGDEAKQRTADERAGRQADSQPQPPTESSVPAAQEKSGEISSESRNISAPGAYTKVEGQAATTTPTKETKMNDEQALRAAMAAAPHDDAPRVVLADWLDENARDGDGKADEAAKLREKVKHGGRTLRGLNPQAANFVYSGSGARRVGQILTTKQGRYVVTHSSSDYVSDDRIEDGDDWSTYKDGPGHYTHVTALPVEDTEKERKDDAKKAKEKADAKTKSESEATQKQSTFDAAWGPVKDQGETYSWPTSIPQPEWTEVANDIKRGPASNYGTAHYVGTLPDGRKVGQRVSTSYDDHRVSYYLPQDLFDEQSFARAHNLGRDLAENEKLAAGSEYYQKEGAEVVAALGRLSPDERAKVVADLASAAKVRNAPAESQWSEAQRHYRDTGYAIPGTWLPDGARGGHRDATAVADAAAKEAAGDQEVLAAAKKLAGYEAKRTAAVYGGDVDGFRSWVQDQTGPLRAQATAKREAKAAQWADWYDSARPALTEEIGKIIPTELVPSALDYIRSEIANGDLRDDFRDPKAWVEDIQSQLADDDGGDIGEEDYPELFAHGLAMREKKAAEEAARKAKEKAEKAAKKKANPDHEVVGNSYPHRERIKSLGGRWDAKNKVWIIPASASGKLPGGLRSRPV